MKQKEIEVRFLEIDSDQLKAKLKELEAEDKGERFFKEIIFYDKDLAFRKEHKFVRLRNDGDTTWLTYKQHHSKGKEIAAIDDVDEIEVTVSDYESTKDLLEKVGLDPFREQEKKRHTFILNGVLVEIDTWPSIPTYVEIEGESEEVIKKTAEYLDLDWGDAYFGSARDAIERVYKIPVSEYRSFTFDRVGE